MADYYPLLAKALAGLPNNSSQNSRQAIYDRARKALIGQLRSMRPPLAEEDIAREDAALDAAISRLESERFAAAPAQGGDSAPSGSTPAASEAPAKPATATSAPSAAP
ncbi:MAG TPA: histidine kinase, partial [Roseiarcus sp.]|nr:histidine kinase [Roseiarcus sp.]